MAIRRIGNQSLPPEIETTSVKPPGSGTSSHTGIPEASEDASSVADSSSSAHLPQRPLDDPAAKAFLSEKLNAGSSGYSGPQTRLRDNEVDTKGWGDDGGTDPGPDPGDASTKDSGAGDVGIGLSHRSRLDGDGHTKSTQGGSPKTGGTTGQTQSGGNVEHDLGGKHDEFRPLVKKKVS